MVRDSRGVFGGPETCARIIKRIIEVVGTTHIGLTFHFGGLGQDRVLKSMERCAKSVWPGCADSLGRHRTVYPIQIFYGRGN